MSSQGHQIGTKSILPYWVPHAVLHSYEVYGSKERVDRKEKNTSRWRWSDARFRAAGTRTCDFNILVEVVVQ